jgi:predicted CxxxxCH...CXXCH cytochrome family protein
MSGPVERHGGRDGFRGHRISRMMRRSLPALLVFFLVLVILALKAPPATTGSIPCDCLSCHVVSDSHLAGCTGCHAYPPATGSHRAHFDNNVPQNTRYGDTAVNSTAAGYIFGCGNCHPLDMANHNNGTVDVELYNASAPAGSLKAKNPLNATYDNVGKTCANVYCHSGYTVTSGPVGLPLTYPPNPVPPGYPVGYALNTVGATSYIMDNTCSNLIYAPYTVTVARDYKTTPAWGATGTSTTCTECHAFPLTTYYPAVSAMAGDSHQWVDENGWNWGHAYNMLGVGGVPCATCHYGSVDHGGGGAYPQAQTANPPTYWAGNIVAYNPAPIKNRSLHVNGVSDVAFDNVNGYRYYYLPYYNNQYDLTAATYNAQTKTCSNVSCHYGGRLSSVQQSPKWGSPYGPYSTSGTYMQCDLCHRHGYLSETCQPIP